MSSEASLSTAVAHLRDAYAALAAARDLLSPALAHLPPAHQKRARELLDSTRTACNAARGTVNAAIDTADEARSLAALFRGGAR